MSTSTDGRLTWSPPATTSDRFRGIGGQPVVQPDGTVVVRIDNNNLTALEAFRSSDGGATWSAPGVIAAAKNHRAGGSNHATSGRAAHLGIDFYAQGSTCSSACSLTVGFVGSSDGGSTWTAAVTLAGPMDPGWLANTGQGRIVGDYNSTSCLAGKAYPVFAVATAPTGSTFNESMNAPATGLALEPGTPQALNDRR